MTTAHAELAVNQLLEPPHEPYMDIPPHPNSAELLRETIEQPLGSTAITGFGSNSEGLLHQALGASELQVDLSTVAGRTFEVQRQLIDKSITNTQNFTSRLLNEAISPAETAIFRVFMDDFVFPRYRIERSKTGQNSETVSDRCKQVELYLTGLANKEIGQDPERDTRPIPAIIRLFADTVHRSYTPEHLSHLFTDYKQISGFRLIKRPTPEESARETVRTKLISGGHLVASEITVDNLTIAKELLPDITNGNWGARALCRLVDPDVFFPESKNDKTLELPKKICGQCDVGAQCLDKALREQLEWGVWGRASERERRAVVRKKSKRSAA